MRFQTQIDAPVNASLLDALIQSVLKLNVMKEEIVQEILREIAVIGASCRTANSITWLRSQAMRSIKPYVMNS